MCSSPDWRQNLSRRRRPRTYTFLVWEWRHVRLALLLLIQRQKSHPKFVQSHANPSHFWLNEGWTTYIERTLQEVLYSPAERGFSFVIGSKALYDSLKGYESQPKYQRLVISFDEGENPDDAYSRIPYEKGANLILHLGQLSFNMMCWLLYLMLFLMSQTQSVL